MSSSNQQIRDRLKGVRDQLSDARSRLNEARKERDAAKEAFGKADFANDVNITQSAEFKAAQDAVGKHGMIEDEVNALREAEHGILEMLGDSGEAVGTVEKGDVPTSGWNGHNLLAQSGEFRHALERGMFSSNSRFGTVDMGTICGRDDFLRGIHAAAPGTAPAGAVGTDTGGIRPDVRGIISPFLKPLSLLDLIPSGTTDSNIVQYVQVTAIPGYAAETAELAAKPQEGLTLVDATAPVRTIAGWVKLARQALDDVAALGTLINTLLPYDVQRRIENQILAGGGTGQDLTGILNTSGIGAPASATGDNVADGILQAITTIVLSDADPNFVTLNPTTWQNLLMLKSAGSGEYMYGSPGVLQSPTIWGLAITKNRLVPQATPVVGDSRGATLLVREGVNVKTSDADQDDFIRNRVTVLAEARIAFPVWRPSAFAKAPLG